MAKKPKAKKAVVAKEPVQEMKAALKRTYICGWCKKEIEDATPDKRYKGEFRACPECGNKLRRKP